jgi:hypothetical protein
LSFTFLCFHTYDLIIQAFKHIFTSPHSAEEVTSDYNPDSVFSGEDISNRKVRRGNATREHNASLIGLRAVTPRALAYTACQVSPPFYLSTFLTILALFQQLRQSLSSSTSWHENDDHFSYIDFYNNIIDYFEVDVGPNSKLRTDNLLCWWTR